jgi:putative membrane protein
MTISDLPLLNAFLNSTSAILLVTGGLLIRRRKITAHRICMVSAFLTSSLFLASYLYYHYNHGSTRFPGTGSWRTFYLTILGTHTVLAVVILPLILLTFARALKGDVAGHRKIARWTLPLWLYVSVTGVLVYVMLYRLEF